MSEPGDRPDPDELLRRVQREEARAKRGKLTIFFGFAPGVGKTYRMLMVARELVRSQRVDVVVGIVETHGREETAALLAGLTILPRRVIEYRGRLLSELDLDAALQRHPTVLLVDELAHTNAPGSRHSKRWQDIDELLAAGIDVLTTMNVQHIESLNDVVAQITHVEVRETVPDAVIDRADVVELIDIAPEELIRRLRDGKVYLGDAAERAASHFFRRGNLLALRELALRRTAQHVDDDVREYREEHRVEATWPAGERILVCVGAAPSSAKLIRAASRMAAGLRCPWGAAYVESDTIKGMSEEDRGRLEAHIRLAESLGASITRLSGPRIGNSLLVHARKHNVTRIILGKPTHSRLRDRLRGSLVDEVVRGSGDIDVHVIRGDDGAERPRRDEIRDVNASFPTAYLSAVALCLGTLVIALAAHSLFALPDIEMLFLLAVMISGIAFGRGPSLLTAALGVAAYDFFFVPPYHTFSVSDRRYFLTFGMMFAVGFVMSELAGKLRRQERSALAREERTSVLYSLTRELASTDVASEIANVAARHASDVFGAPAVVLSVSANGELSTLGASPHGAELPPRDLGVAKWAFEHDDVVGRGTDTLPGALALCAPLRVGDSRIGVIALLLAEKSPLTSDQRSFLDIFRRQVAGALGRVRLADDARASSLRAKTEEMRSSLLSAVSHDLRTPLASITGAATTLRDEKPLSSDTRLELVESIVSEAERLERLVANLLDMTRLESGGVVSHRDWIPLDELVGSALTRLERRLATRPVTVKIEDDVPLLFVDPVLFEQVFVNLFENADKHTPPGSPIEVRGAREDDGVAIEVLDQGPGIAHDETEAIFAKFKRGSTRGVAGSGLGLAICRGIVEAHGGAITASNRAAGGAAFRIVLPSVGQAPSIAPTEEIAS